MLATVGARLPDLFCLVQSHAAMDKRAQRFWQLTSCFPFQHAAWLATGVADEQHDDEDCKQGKRGTSHAVQQGTRRERIAGLRALRLALSTKRSTTARCSHVRSSQSSQASLPCQALRTNKLARLLARALMLSSLCCLCRVPAKAECRWGRRTRMPWEKPLRAQ